MSSATVPPWLSPWAPGLVYGQRVYQQAHGDERGRFRPRLTVYTYGHGNSGTDGLKFSSWSESVDNAGGTEGVLRWERVPLPWHAAAAAAAAQPGPLVLDRPLPYDNTIHGQAAVAEVAGEETEGAALTAWGGVLRGWACGATLLALLLLFMRFRDWKIMIRRRRQRQRQRTNVRAISHVEGQPTAMVDMTSACSVELPPPYSTCGVPSDPALGLGPGPGPGPGPGSDPSPGSSTGPNDEEAPPTYSNCVDLFNKNGVTAFTYETNLDVSLGIHDSEWNNRLERIIRAYSISFASPESQMISEGNTNGFDLDDDNFGRINLPPANLAVDDAANLNGDAVVPLSADDTLGDTNIGPNDTNIAPLDISNDSNDGPKDGSVYIV